MLPIKGRFRLYTTDCGCCLSTRGEPLDTPIPKELVFDAAVDPLSTTLLLSGVWSGRDYYRKALLKQLVWWAVFIVWMLLSAFLSLQAESMLVAFLVMTPIVFCYDKIFHLPTKVLRDDEKGTLYVSAGYFVSADGTRIALCETK